MDRPAGQHRRLLQRLDLRRGVLPFGAVRRPGGGAAFGIDVRHRADPGTGSHGDRSGRAPDRLPLRPGQRRALHLPHRRAGQQDELRVRHRRVPQHGHRPQRDRHDHRPRRPWQPRIPDDMPEPGRQPLLDDVLHLLPGRHVRDAHAERQERRDPDGERRTVRIGRRHHVPDLVRLRRGRQPHHGDNPTGTGLPRRADDDHDLHRRQDRTGCRQRLRPGRPAVEGDQSRRRGTDHDLLPQR